jgi:hypothetical protein
MKQHMKNQFMRINKNELEDKFIDINDQQIEQGKQLNRINQVLAHEEGICNDLEYKKVLSMKVALSLLKNYQISSKEIGKINFFNFSIWNVEESKEDYSDSEKKD